MLVLVFILGNAVTSAISIYQYPHDEQLSRAEATAVGSLSTIMDSRTVAWSDDRIATTFLYYQPRAFTTLDLAFNSSAGPLATIAVFYTGNCQRAASYVAGTGAGVAIVTQYMATQGVVERSASLEPSSSVLNCFNQFSSRIYDNGAVIAYTI